MHDCSNVPFMASNADIPSTETCQPNSINLKMMNANSGVEPLSVGSYVPVSYQFPMTVDTSHSPTPIQTVKPLSKNDSSTKYQFHQRSTIKWNEAGISISAKRQLPFVHRFRGLPPPAGPPPPLELLPSVSTIGKKATQYQANPVGALQERFQAQGIYPSYNIIQADGASHCPTFIYQVTISDFKATGGGTSKKQAKQNAARAMLDKLESLESGMNAPELTNVSQGLVLAIANPPLVDYMASTLQPPGEISGSNPVGLLQELCVKNGLPVAVYETQSVSGLPHERTFELVCKVGHLSITGKGPSKKEAKRQAASEMLDKLKNTTSVQSMQEMVIQKNHHHKDPSKSSSSVVEIFKSQIDCQRPKFQTLLSTSHWSPTIDVCSMLSDLCSEQDLELNYTYLDKIDGANNVLCIAQVSSLIYPGVGQDKPNAREDAARNVLRTLQGLAHI